MPVQRGSSETIAVTHIFSSDLQRASVTASAILDAQRKRGETHDKDSIEGPTKVTKSADLRERDFRSGEGTRFGASSGPEGSRGGRNAFADAESWDEMSVRAKRFIDEHLDCLLLAEASDEDDNEDRRAIVVVAHGLILNVLLSMLLLRYTPAEMTRLQPPQLSGAGSMDRKPNQLRVPWSNTGFLVLHASRLKTKSLSDDANGSTLEAKAETSSSVKLRVVSINCTEHLEGLKKTRGGIGSAQFDPKQKTMDSFFGRSAKRQKRGDDA
ncbi:MAG: hypothetical protein STHCBS139747_002423 [Sporothrix thermara]